MALLRRDFLKLGLLQALAVQVPRAEAANFENQKRSQPSVLQGPSDESRVQFSVVHYEPNLKAQVETSGSETVLPDRQVTHTNPNSQDNVTHLEFSNLWPNEIFQLVLRNSNNEVIDRREFQTLSESSNPKFVFASCMDDGRHESAIWTDLLAQEPDAIFFIGDAVYADNGKKEGESTPDRLWRRYCESRRTLEIYYSKKLVPVIAMWDDHESGVGNPDVDYPFLEAAQINFKKFFPQNTNYCRYFSQGPGMSAHFRWSGQEFLLLDDRSFRQKKTINPDDYWGQAQTQWMKSCLSANRGTNWIVNGVQFFPKIFWKESLSQNGPKSLKELTNFIRDTKSKVVFVSGDMHYSELTKIRSSVLGYTGYEITSSSMHTSCPWGAFHLVPNSGRMAATTRRNYVIVNTQQNGTELEVNLESRSKSNRVNFHYSFKI